MVIFTFVSHLDELNGAAGALDQGGFVGGVVVAGQREGRGQPLPPEGLWRLHQEDLAARQRALDPDGAVTCHAALHRVAGANGRDGRAAAVTASIMRSIARR